MAYVYARIKRARSVISRKQDTAKIPFGIEIFDSGNICVLDRYNPEPSLYVDVFRNLVLIAEDEEWELVMSIFNRFFDDRLNGLSENRFFSNFLKFDCDPSIILKSKNRSLRLAEATPVPFNYLLAYYL